MKIKEIVNALEIFAPLPLQDGFDNAGLQIGLTDAEATGALLCLDVTEAVVDEAIALGYNLIVSHHPLIFKGYKSITGRDYVERCILKAITAGRQLQDCRGNRTEERKNPGTERKPAAETGHLRTAGTGRRGT